VPSANSVAMLDLLRLGRMTGSPVATSGPLVAPGSSGAALEEKAARIARAFAGEVGQTPMAYTQLMIALDFALGPSYEVVVAGRPQADDTRSMLRALRARFLPNAVVLFRPSDQPEPAIARLAPFTRDQKGLDGQPTAYVCLNHACKSPTTDAAQMLGLLAPAGAKATPK